MKNKFLATAIAVGLAIPCAFMATGCHNHTFKSSWSYNETHHWYDSTCEHKGEKDGYATHTFSAWQTLTPATHEDPEIEKRTCSGCGYFETRDGDSPLGHDYSPDWSYNDEYHWRESVCEHEGEKAAYDEHSYIDESDYDCDVCNYKRDVVGYSVWDGTRTSLPTEVSGVIAINTAEQFASFAKAVNEGEDFDGITIELSTDIDLNYLSWESIGYGVLSTSKCFNGTFDGKNHTIYNLNIVGKVTDTGEQESAGVGLFGQIGNNAIIKDLKIENAVVKGHHYVGIVAGYAHDGSIISNCEVKNVAINIDDYIDGKMGEYIGAVVGYVETNCSVTNCDASNVEMYATNDAGQIIGVLETGATQNNNTVENIEITDADGVLDAKNNDYIREQVVGREV